MEKGCGYDVTTNKVISNTVLKLSKKEGVGKWKTNCSWQS